MPSSDCVSENNPPAYVLGVPMRRKVIIACLTILVLLLVLVCVLTYSYNSKPSAKERKVSIFPYVSIESALYTDADPCVNFYEFACGNWTQDPLFTDGDDRHTSAFSSLQIFVKKKNKEIFLNGQVSDDLPRVVNDAFRMYHTCMSSSDTKKSEINFLLKYFKESLGGWPVLDSDNWDGSCFDWLKVSAYLKRTLGISTIVDMASCVDEKNTSQTVLYLSPPEYEESAVSKFLSYHILLSVFNSFNGSDVKIEDMSESIDEIIKTAIKWQKYFSLESGLHKNRTRMTFGEMKAKMSNFDWMHYIQLVFNDDSYFSENDIVYVDNFEFLNGAIARFKKEEFSNFQLANYFGWLVLNEVWFYMPEASKIYSSLFEASEEEISADFCWRAVTDMHQCSLDYLYVQNMPHSGIQDGEIIFENIKNALEKLMRHSDWLDKATKDSAIVKLNSMTTMIGFKSYLKNKEEFEKLFKNFPAFKSSVLQAYFDIMEFSVSTMLIDEIKFQNFTKFVTHRPITHVSAYYEPHQNVLTIPLSMFNPPFYYYDSPWYFNFAAIGSIIAHEILHGFDRTGSMLDETGAPKNWWSKSALEIYRERSQCFLDQYSRYRGEHSSMLSLDENIGDSEGLRLSFLAYTEWIKINGADSSYPVQNRKFSPRQMFFVVFGSMWCTKTYQRSSHGPPQDRANGPLSNSEDFSQAFKCPIDSPLNPDRKCRIW